MVVAVHVGAEEVPVAHVELVDLCIGEMEVPLVAFGYDDVRPRVVVVVGVVVLFARRARPERLARSHDEDVAVGRDADAPGARLVEPRRGPRERPRPQEAAVLAVEFERLVGAVARDEQVAVGLEDEALGAR